MAENRLNNLKRHGGYKGSITSFGWPRVEHGQVVQVIDKKYEERNTKNFVDEVEINFSANNGYKRTIDIGKHTEMESLKHLLNRFPLVIDTAIVQSIEGENAM